MASQAGCSLKCLICYAPRVTKCQGQEESIHPSSSSAVSMTTKKIIAKQLHVIFILKDVLELSSKELESYLETRGNPENWIWLCDACNEEIDQVKDVYRELQRISARFEEAKWQIQEKITETNFLSEVSSSNENILDREQQSSSSGGEEGEEAAATVEIMEKCRAIVCQRGTKPPPLTMSSDPFIRGDKMASELAAAATGGMESGVDDDSEEVEPEILPPMEEEEDIETITRQHETRVKRAKTTMPSNILCSGSVPTPEGVDGDNNKVEFENALGESYNNDAPSRLPTTTPSIVSPGRRQTLKRCVPCPLCKPALHYIEFSHMGRSCRRLEECMQEYKGPEKYLTCSICKLWRCSKEDIISYAEHVQLCREGFDSSTVPLSQKIFSCNLCREPESKYLEFDELITHLYKRHQHSYHCTGCPERFETLADCTVDHWRKKHREMMKMMPANLRVKLDTPKLPKIPWICPACFQEFPIEKKRDVHFENCPELEDQLQPERLYKCAISTCSRAYFWEEELKIHDVIAHGHHHLHSKSFLCDQCHKYFQTDKKLKWHRMREHRLDLYKCKLCSHSYLQKNSLEYHMRLKHGDVEEGSKKKIEVVLETESLVYDFQPVPEYSSDNDNSNSAGPIVYYESFDCNQNEAQT